MFFVPSRRYLSYHRDQPSLPDGICPAGNFGSAFGDDIQIAACMVGWRCKLKPALKSLGFFAHVISALEQYDKRLFSFCIRFHLLPCNRRARMAPLARSAPCNLRLALAATQRWRAATRRQAPSSAAAPAARGSRTPNVRRVHRAPTQGRSARKYVPSAPLELPRQSSEVLERRTRVNACAPPTPSSRAPRASATPASRVTSTRQASSALRAAWGGTRRGGAS